MMVVVVCNPILDSNATEVKVGLVELRLELSLGCDNSSSATLSCPHVGQCTYSLLTIS